MPPKAEKAAVAEKAEKPSNEAAKLSAARERDLEAAISSITKAYGEGSIMRLGVAQALSGQNDAALATLAKVQGNRARLAKLWTVYVQTKTAPAAVAAAPAT